VKFILKQCSNFLAKISLFDKREEYVKKKDLKVL